MKWCRFRIGQKVSYGIVEDDARVTEVSGSPFETYSVTTTTYPLSAVKLGPSRVARYWTGASGVAL